MHPVAREAVTCSPRLSDLRLVVGEHQVNSATVNVELAAEVLYAHGGALDVPAGVALAPGARPAHDVTGLGELPEREVTRVALLGAHVHPRAGLLLLDSAAGELAVIVPGVDVEVHAALGLVGKPAGDELFDQPDLLRDVPRGPRRDIGPPD